MTIAQEATPKRDAGRPRKHRGVKGTIRKTEETAEGLKTICAHLGVSGSDWVERKVKDELVALRHGQANQRPPELAMALCLPTGGDGASDAQRRDPNRAVRQLPALPSGGGSEVPQRQPQSAHGAMALSRNLGEPSTASHLPRGPQLGEHRDGLALGDSRAALAEPQRTSAPTLPQSGLWQRLRDPLIKFFGEKLYQDLLADIDCQEFEQLIILETAVNLVVILNEDYLDDLRSAIKGTGELRQVLLRPRTCKEPAPPPRSQAKEEKDPVIADIEQRLADQDTFDPKRTNQGANAIRAKLFVALRDRQAELRTPRPAHEKSPWSPDRDGASRRDLTRAEKASRPDSS